MLNLFFLFFFIPSIFASPEFEAFNEHILNNETLKPVFIKNYQQYLFIKNNNFDLSTTATVELSFGTFEICILAHEKLKYYFIFPEQKLAIEAKNSNIIKEEIETLQDYNHLYRPCLTFYYNVKHYLNIFKETGDILINTLGKFEKNIPFSYSQFFKAILKISTENSFFYNCLAIHVNKKNEIIYVVPRVAQALLNLSLYLKDYIDDTDLEKNLNVLRAFLIPYLETLGQEERVNIICDLKESEFIKNNPVFSDKLFSKLLLQLGIFSSEHLKKLRFVSEQELANLGFEENFIQNSLQPEPTYIIEPSVPLEPEV